MRRFTCVAAFIGGLGVVASALAEDPAPKAAVERPLLQPPSREIASPITDRFAVRGVYFSPAIDTLIRYDSSAGTPGTLIAAGKELGLGRHHDAGSADLMFRMLERHRIHASYYQLTRDGDVVLDRPVSFGDNIYDANERVLSHMGLRKLDLIYTYSLLRKQRVELGLGLGIHLLQLEGSLEAPARFVRDKLDTAGPFPTLAADFSWRITRRFSFNAAGQFLQGNTSEVDGQYASWSADVQFRSARNLAFGLGYGGTRFRVTSTDPDMAGYLRLQYYGPQAFLRVSF